MAIHSVTSTSWLTLIFLEVGKSSNKHTDTWYSASPITSHCVICHLSPAAAPAAVAAAAPAAAAVIDVPSQEGHS